MKSFKQFLLEKTEEEMIDNPFFNQHIARLHGAIVNAEHFIAPDKPITDPFAYEENRYIRTKKRPDPGKKASSAYGPGQITRDTARGFYEQNPEYFEGIEDYTQKFIEQGNKFLSSSPDDEVYGFGGKGELYGPEYHNQNLRLSAAIMMGKAREKGLDLSQPLSDEDLHTFLSYWGGEDAKPSYIARVRNAMEKVQIPKNWRDVEIPQRGKKGQQKKPTQPTQQVSPPKPESNQGTLDTIVNTGREIGKSLVAPTSFTAMAAEKQVARWQEPRSVSQQDNIHVVKPGDNLSKIAGGDQKLIDAIVAANAIKDPNKIYPGQKLTIPSR